MASIHVWGGGPFHPTRAQTDQLRAALEPHGHVFHYGDTRDMFAPDRLAGADLLVLMGLDWSGMVGLKSGLWEEGSSRSEQYEPLSDEHLGAIRAHVEAGRPLLCHHAAIASFDDRVEELRKLFDGRWIWGQSTHSPYHEFEVRVTRPEHPANDGLSDFTISDELYYRLTGPVRSEVLLEAEYEGSAWPLAWAGAYHGAKTAYSGLGHDMQSYASPSLQRFLLNLIDWLTTSDE